MDKIFKPIIRGWTPATLVTVLLLVVAGAMMAAQFVYALHPRTQFGLTAQDQYGSISLWRQDIRGTGLGKITDLVKRDMSCSAISAVGRRLDMALPPDARIFITGVLGRESAPRQGMYSCLRYYLYPRDIEITLQGKATAVNNDYEGVGSEVPTVLRTNGFDYLIRIESIDQVKLLPLADAREK